MVVEVVEVPVVYFGILSVAVVAFALSRLRHPGADASLAAGDSCLNKSVLLTWRQRARSLHSKSTNPEEPRSSSTNKQTTLFPTCCHSLSKSGVINQPVTPQKADPPSRIESLADEIPWNPLKPVFLTAPCLLFLSPTEIGAQCFETSSKTGTNVGESGLQSPSRTTWSFQSSCV